VYKFFIEYRTKISRRNQNKRGIPKIKAFISTFFNVPEECGGETSD
jgi:hypothetical protein